LGERAAGCAALFQRLHPVVAVSDDFGQFDGVAASDLRSSNDFKTVFQAKQ
jgi:hypothetical protein